MDLFRFGPLSLAVPASPAHGRRPPVAVPSNLPRPKRPCPIPCWRSGGSHGFFFGGENFALPFAIQPIDQREQFALAARREINLGNRRPDANRPKRDLRFALPFLFDFGDDRLDLFDPIIVSSFVSTLVHGWRGNGDRIILQRGRDGGISGRTFKQRLNFIGSNRGFHIPAIMSAKCQQVKKNSQNHC